MTRFPIPVAMTFLAATPALAAGDYGFFSFRNTDFIVLIGFLVFLGILLYFKVPSTVAGLLDKRAAGIRSDLDEARGLRDEAQTLLASYERKQREVEEQAGRIVKNARAEAETAAEEARAELERAVARRLAGAEEQIASAEAAAVAEVKNRAIEVATRAAAAVIAERMDAQRADALIDDSIRTVGAKLH
ncbi:ATP synthase F0 subcomplex B subunit [Hasllibacter halocynthiae]|uniref:ATP synthase subunit b n=1 Tax=Hasllibacter halocynthiae TaxID=595589 RepID=A0A2T0X3M9_9RHOB|nr:F0F1 ATP synthase subunit B [Hasllibacter halocynthiae]PRY93552.1 ATP synthase F0 subcomplex B subunit [Hasllibacter halocynthiae]